MKKIVIPVIAVMVGFILLIGYGVLSSVECSDYSSAISAHVAFIENNEGTNAVAQNEDGAVRISLDNVWVFKTAANRTAIEYRLLPPVVRNLNSITVTFPDGAVFTVYQGGMDKNKDVAYIRYEFGNKKRWFSITGYDTFTRVRACTSLAGFGSPNSAA